MASRKPAVKKPSPAKKKAASPRKAAVAKSATKSKSATAKKSPAADIHRIKITLKDSKPPIWRRIEVPGKIRLDQLHDAIQSAMGWTDSHLHQFIIDGEFYGPTDGMFEMDEMWDERKFFLDKLVAVNGKCHYEYDFGDGWIHEIKVEKAVAKETGAKYPRLTEGERACPPEDCGGLWGYYHLLEVQANPKHPEHAELMEWLGDDIDPEAFDIAKARRAMGSPRLAIARASTLQEH